MLHIWKIQIKSKIYITNGECVNYKLKLSNTNKHKYHKIDIIQHKRSYKWKKKYLLFQWIWSHYATNVYMYVQHVICVGLTRNINRCLVHKQLSLSRFYIFNLNIIEGKFHTGHDKIDRWWFYNGWNFCFLQTIWFYFVC